LHVTPLMQNAIPRVCQEALRMHPCAVRYINMSQFICSRKDGWMQCGSGLGQAGRWVGRWMGRTGRVGGWSTWPRQFFMPSLKGRKARGAPTTPVALPCTPGVPGAGGGGAEATRNAADEPPALQ
jgi:hypothetical protein